MREFRFGVQSFNATSGVDWREQARKAESLGYSALHLADHILGPGPAFEKANHPPQNLAAVPAMAYAAAVTSTLKIGCRVFCIDYHLPVVLLKEAMTIDFLSDGRLELGLGAGWVKEEYNALGLHMDDAGVRIDRLQDVVEAVKRWREPGMMEITNATIDWKDFEAVPKPVSKPPIMIGGGSPRVLRLAGREADIVSLNFNNRMGMIGPDGVRLSTASETSRKVGWIREGAGERMDEIEIEIGAYFTFVMDQAKPVVDRFAQMFGLNEAEMLAHPHALFGGVESICEEIERRREAFGISYVTVPMDVADAFAPVVARLRGR